MLIDKHHTRGGAKLNAPVTVLGMSACCCGIGAWNPFLFWWKEREHATPHHRRTKAKNGTSIHPHTHTHTHTHTHRERERERERKYGLGHKPCHVW